jgi:hypothetical protein
MDDLPGSVEKGIPGVAAVIDDVAGFEDAVREPVVAHILPNIFDRIEFRAFGGSGIMVILAGTSNLADRCHPA